jgi:hypothetical protein
MVNSNIATISQPDGALFIPNSYQTPNAVADKLMPLLLPNEFVVLHFMIRHILGFRDHIATRSRCISLTMLEHGYGPYPGCGLSRPAIVQALKELVTYRVIEKLGRPTSRGQKWQLLFASIDMDGLRKRQESSRQKNRKRTAVARTKRTAAQTSGKSNIPPSGKSDLPISVEASGKSDNPPSGKSDNPPSGKSDLRKETQPTNTTTKTIPDTPLQDASELIMAILDTDYTDAITSGVKAVVSRKLNAAFKAKPRSKTKRDAWLELVASLEQERGHLADAIRKDSSQANQDALRKLVIQLQELQTRDPDTAKPKRASAPSIEDEPLYHAIATTWGLPITATGRLWQLTHYLRGESKSGKWAEYPLSKPMTIEELRGYWLYRERSGRKGFNMPERPEQIQKSIEEFRDDPKHASFVTWANRPKREPANGAASDQSGTRKPAQGSIQINEQETTMPRHLRIRYYEDNNIPFNPETGIRLDAADPTEYVGFSQEK